MTPQEIADFVRRATDVVINTRRFSENQRNQYIEKIQRISQAITRIVGNESRDVRALFKDASAALKDDLNDLLETTWATSMTKVIVTIARVITNMDGPEPRTQLVLTLSNLIQTSLSEIERRGKLIVSSAKREIDALEEAQALERMVADLSLEKAQDYKNFKTIKAYILNKMDTIAQERDAAIQELVQRTPLNPE